MIYNESIYVTVLCLSHTSSQGTAHLDTQTNGRGGMTQIDLYISLASVWDPSNVLCTHFSSSHLHYLYQCSTRSSQRRRDYKYCASVLCSTLGTMRHWATIYIQSCHRWCIGYTTQVTKLRCESIDLSHTGSSHYTGRRFSVVEQLLPCASSAQTWIYDISRVLVPTTGTCSTSVLRLYYGTVYDGISKSWALALPVADSEVLFASSIRSPKFLLHFFWHVQVKTDGQQSQSVSKRFGLFLL